MTGLDDLLTSANPYPAVPERMSVLAVEQAAFTHGRRSRRRLVTWVSVALIGGLLLGGGGVAAATAAGWIGLGGWVDGADGRGVRIVTVSDGSQFACVYAFHFEGAYAQPESYKNITAGLAEAHRYIHNFDPLSVKMDPQWMNHFVPPVYTPDEAEAADRTSAWVTTVSMKVNRHLKSLGLAGVATESFGKKCTLVTAK